MGNYFLSSFIAEFYKKYPLISIRLEMGDSAYVTHLVEEGLADVVKMPADYTGPTTYDALTKAGANVLGYGAFLTAVINFLLLAFVIFCMLKALSSMRRKLELEAEKTTPPTPENIVLLREILADGLLSARSG